MNYLKKVDKIKELNNYRSNIDLAFTQGNDFELNINIKKYFETCIHFYQSKKLSDLEFGFAVSAIGTATSAGMFFDSPTYCSIMSLGESVECDALSGRTELCKQEVIKLINLLQEVIEQN
jgi:hypothetical protein